MDQASGTADSARMWITSVPAFGPDDVGVVLGVDAGSAEPAERMTGVLLNRGHEGEEGVFYLLPFDLCARYERAGDRLAVSVLALRETLAGDLADHPGALHTHLAGLPSDPADADRVVLLRREIVTDFVPPERGGEKMPVLLLHHEGTATSLTELLAQSARGEAGIAVLRGE
ncbi:hypothetical protein ABZX85_15050 [Streptomyces sp. NPDC004539]|uniref:hypothetical protein n=1 Tax=Streptomyces sp. NPDC004539 TaxID=3154280 RepID=UPI0033AFD242